MLIRYSELYFTRNDKQIRQAGGVVAILVRNNIGFSIVDTWSSINADNETITIIFKNSQLSTNVSTICIPPASLINTTLISNIKNLM